MRVKVYLISIFRHAVVRFVYSNDSNLRGAFPFMWRPTARKAQRLHKFLTSSGADVRFLVHLIFRKGCSSGQTFDINPEVRGDNW